MRLATVITAARDASDGPATRAAVQSGDRFVLLAAQDLSELLETAGWREQAAAAAAEAAGGAPHESIPVGAARFATVLPRPSKVICCGLNYADHIAEMGRELPEYPTLFAKYADTLIGDGEAIDAAGHGDRLDWEAELAVVVGAPLKDASPEEAAAAIAGYTVANDISMRDWQSRTLQWFQGKAFDRTTPLGPVLVTPDECDPEAGVRVRCLVNGEEVQNGNTRTLVFDRGRACCPTSPPSPGCAPATSSSPAPPAASAWAPPRRASCTTATWSPPRSRASARLTNTVRL